MYSRISDIETSVNTFLSMKYKNEVGYTLEDMYLHFTNKNIIPRKYLPFACDAGSNLFCINLENEKIVIIWLVLAIEVHWEQWRHMIMTVSTVLFMQN